MAYTYYTSISEVFGNANYSSFLLELLIQSSVLIVMDYQLDIGFPRRMINQSRIFSRLIYHPVTTMM